MIHVSEGLLYVNYKNEVLEEELTDSLPMVEVCHLAVWSANVCMVTFMVMWRSCDYSNSQCISLHITVHM